MAREKRVLTCDTLDQVLLKMVGLLWTTMGRKKSVLTSDTLDQVLLWLARLLWTISPHSLELLLR